MRIANFVRLTKLEYKAASLRVGLGPWVVGALFVLTAHVQEPSFFRASGLEIAWPATIATCDGMSLLFAVYSLTSTPRANSAVAARAVGAWIAGCVYALAMLGLGGIYDATGSSPESSYALAWVAARLVLLWLPVCLVTQAHWLRHRRLPARFLVLATAYLMQASMLPASLAQTDCLMPRVAAFGASLVLSLLWIRTTPAGTQPISLHANRSPR